MRILLFPVAIQELEPGATPCRGGRCAVAILTNRQQLKKYSDYDYAFPPKGSNLHKGPCRARDEMVYLYTSMHSIASQSI